MSEGKGQGGKLKRETKAKEEKPIAKLCVPKKQKNANLYHFHVCWISWCLHSNILPGIVLYLRLFVCIIHLKICVLGQVHHQWEEGDRQMTEHLSLLQLWLGLATSSGTLLGGLLCIHQSRHFFISTRLLLQCSMSGCALAMFSIYCVTGYYG